MPGSPSHTARIVVSLCASFLCAQAWAQSAPAKPSAAVVLLGEADLNAKELHALLDGAITEMKESSGYELDGLKSLQAGSEAVTLGCTLDADCLIRVAGAAQVDAVVGVQAEPEGRRTLKLELVWAAADARGLPGESASKIARSPRALEQAVRTGVRKIIPAYARKGVGGLTVLAEAGSEILVDGQQVARAPMDEPVVLSAGVHRIDAVTPRHTTVTRSIDIVEARRHVVDLPSPSEAIEALSVPAPPPPAGHALTTASLVVGGAGVLATAGGVVLGLQANALGAQIRQGACPAVPCTSGISQLEAQRLYQRADSHATLANIGVAGGALMLVGAGVMYYLAQQDAQ